jgi:hypothetical protein
LFIDIRQQNVLRFRPWRRSQAALDAEHRIANSVFLSLGYSQEQIDRWPKTVVELARNLVANGGDREVLVALLKEHHVSPPTSSKLPRADQFFGPSPK